jgi:DNA-binding response OmpR family regulator
MSQAREATTLRRETVLIVDDDAELRDTFRDALSAHGYAALCARNGREALQLLTRPAPGVCVPAAILLDLMMPEMNGWELLARLRASRSLADIPVLVVSVCDAARALEGVASYLEKPVEIGALLDALRVCCRRVSTPTGGEPGG